MAGFSNYLIGRIQDRTFGAVAFTPPADLRLAIFTVMPDDDGNGGTEMTGGNYSRPSVTNNNSNFPDTVLGTGTKANAVAISWPTPGSDWGNAVAVGVYGSESKKLISGVAASTNLFTATAHGFADGDAVILTGSPLPSGVQADTVYYVIYVSADTFQLEESVGGGFIDISINVSSGAFVHSNPELLAVCPITPRTVASGVVFTVAAGSMRFSLTGFSHYLNKAILDHVFGNQTFTIPEIHCSIWSVAPDAYGVGGIEMVGTSYARKQITNNSTEFPAASSGVKTNFNTVTFTAAGAADWADAVGQAIYDAAAGGNLLMVTAIGATPVANGAAWVIPAGALKITMS